MEDAFILDHTVGGNRYPSDGQGLVGYLVEQGHSSLNELASKVGRIIQLRTAVCALWHCATIMIDMELLQGVVRALRKAGMKSDYTRMAGVHVHISGEGHTPQTIRNLVNIMAAHESQLAKAIRIDRNRMNRYCRTVDPKFLEGVNRKKPRTMEELEDLWYQTQNADGNRYTHYNSSRYRVCNLHSFFHGHHTIEFRLFQFDCPHDGKQNGMHAGQVKSFIQLCLAINQLAKMVRTASPKPQQTENEKYAMRCWMLRLGFIGDEFKTAREYYLNNMEGNSAWR